MKPVPKPGAQFSDVRRVQAATRPEAVVRRSVSRKVSVGGSLLLVLLLLGGTLLFLHSRQNTQPIDGKASLAKVEGRVGRHFVLPTDEVPALATITDASKLTTPFFKRAQNGDKILIYQKHKIAIMYRASIDRIIEVGPVSLGNLGGQ